MDNLRQLLVAVAALTLLFSIVSGANPNYFAGISAYAQDEEDGEDDNSGSSDYEEDDDDSGRHNKDERKGDEHTVAATFGSSSKVMLGIDDEIEDDEGATDSVEADLKIETEGGDLPDGEHDVALVCETPSFEKVFDSNMEVAEGDGEFEAELAFVNGTTYENCVVSIGDMDVEIPNFTVMATGHDDEDEAGSTEGEEDDDERKGRSQERKAELESEDGKTELEVEVDTNMTDGSYDAKFICEEPAVDMTIEDGFVVQDGEGKLEAELELADGTYEGCEVTVDGEVIASFDSFATRQGEEEDDEEEEENDEGDVEEKRKQKRKDIVSTTSGESEHKRRMNASPASTGDYEPNWNYTLVANGTATQFADDEEELTAESTSNSSDTSTNSSSVEASSVSDVELAVDMAVWKSNKALILLNVLNGTIEANGEVYTIELGYALYSVSHDAMRLGAFVSDEDGNIYKLKLRGTVEGEDAEFPMASGESIDLIFEGNSGPARNSFDHWHLELEGTVEAE